MKTKILEAITPSMDALPRELWDFILSFLHQPVPSAFTQLNTVVHDLNRWLGGGQRMKWREQRWCVVSSTPSYSPTHTPTPYVLSSFIYAYSFIYFSFY
jgi:hypothetical protein